MEYRVRVTRVEPGRMEDFVHEWTANVARLRRRRGFTIVGAWVLEGRDEFMWILGYDGEEGFDAADDAYRASEERRAMEPDPSRFVDDRDDRVARRIV